MITAEHAPGGSSAIHRHNAHAFVYVHTNSPHPSSREGHHSTVGWMLDPDRPIREADMDTLAWMCPLSAITGREQMQQCVCRSRTYSMTSSALANSASGTLKPRVLAVLRLMTKSIFVGCCT